MLGPRCHGCTKTIDFCFLPFHVLAFLNECAFCFACIDVEIYIFQMFWILITSLKLVLDTKSASQMRKNKKIKNYHWYFCAGCLISLRAFSKYVINNTGLRLSPCSVPILEVNFLGSGTFLRFIERFLLLRRYLITSSSSFLCCLKYVEN